MQLRNRSSIPQLLPARCANPALVRLWHTFEAGESRLAAKMGKVFEPVQMQSGS